MGQDSIKTVVDIAHIHFSQERLYIALLMGSAMAIVLLAWMWKIYPDGRRKLAIIGGAVVIGIAAFLFSQTQAMVSDVNYMRGMIPHHSIAILTSDRAELIGTRAARYTPVYTSRMAAGPIGC